jgi:hypothetical protein
MLVSQHASSKRQGSRAVALAGKVSRIRLLGDYAHATRIAFVEFHHAEGALAALNCSGALLGARRRRREGTHKAA